MQALLSFVIREGRNRQVREMCDAIGHPVVRLRRVRIGPIRTTAPPGRLPRSDSRDEVAAAEERTQVLGAANQASHRRVPGRSHGVPASSTAQSRSDQSHAEAERRVVDLGVGDQRRRELQHGGAALPEIVRRAATDSTAGITLSSGAVQQVHRARAAADYAPATAPDRRRARVTCGSRIGPRSIDVRAR